MRGLSRLVMHESGMPRGHASPTRTAGTPAAGAKLAALAAMTAWLLSPTIAEASGQTPEERACTNAVSQNLHHLTETISRASWACIQDHTLGDLDGTLEGCLLSDPSALAATARQTPEQVFDESCDALPEFGVTDAATTRFAATTSVSRILRDAFGSGFDGAIKTFADDGSTSRCQQAIAKRLQRCHLSTLRRFNRCQETALEHGATSLEHCVEQASMSTQSCDVSTVLDQQCSGLSLAEAFPGCGAEGGHDTSECLGNIVNRQTCQALNRSGGHSADCGLQDDGLSNASTVALACDTNPVAFLDADGNSLELADGGKLQLDCPVVPNPTPTNNTAPDYGMNVFAWNAFIAMNWPAIDDGELRGIPDLTKQFAGAAPGELTVWESLKEKREVFYLGSCTGNRDMACSSDSQCEPEPGGNGTCDLTTPPGTTGRSAASLVWSGPLQYGPQGNVLASAPLCEGVSEDDLPDRRVTSSTKLHFDSLGETVEVQSEALETVDQLCGGYLTNAAAQCAVDPSKHACCTIQGQAVGPRVWKGDPAQGGRPVLYEVKVNYDYFNYVTDPDRMFYLDSEAAPAAASAEFLLPWRSNVLALPSNSAQENAVTGYDAQSCLLDMGHDGTSDVPCPIGSIHVKSAWLLLDGEDPTKYHTADASYFKQDPNDPTEICETSGTFGLIGLHIIQRTHHVEAETPPAEPKFTPIGGSYIFATWEHTDNDEAGFRYSNYHFPTEAFYPATTDTLELTRMFPLPDGVVTVNDQVHTALGCPDSGSVWCNYEQVGVQFSPVDQTDPTITDGEQPYYLANLVIESNIGLQMFQGLPPNTDPIDNYQGVAPEPINDTDAYDHVAPNNSVARTGKNMGGCLGCHGVAQLNGFTFSFVSQDGQRGAGIDTETPGQFGPAPSP